MKRNLYPIFALSVMMLSACFPKQEQGETNTPQGETAAETLPQVVTYSLTDSVGPTFETEDGPKRPSANVQINLSTEGIPANIGTEMARLFTGKEHTALPEAVQQYGDSIGQAYISELESLYSDTALAMTQPYEYLFDARGTVATDSREGILGYQISVSSYQGGAHSNYFEQWYNFDMETGAPIKCADAFDMTREGEIKAAIREQLCRDKDCKDVQQLQDSLGLLAIGDVFLSDTNFLLLAKGARFLYNPYDIGPWAAGKMEVFLPYDRLKSLCTYAPK